MNINTSLYNGEHICLAAIDYEKDPEIESRWTHDAEYLQLLDTAPARPLSPASMKKRYEQIEKDVEEQKNLVYFTIRMRSDDPQIQDRLIGFIRLNWIEWSHGGWYVKIGIGDPADRHKGYGTEALNLLLRYAFSEFNLFRLTAVIPEYNLGAQRLFAKAGFVEEVRRRQAVNRYAKRWDLLTYGLLRTEWKEA